MKDIHEIAHSFRAKLLDEGFSGTVTLDAPIAPMTWYRIGGPASILAEAATIDDIKLVMALLTETPLPLLVMGGGTNLLVSDDGFRGLVLRLSGDFIKLVITDGLPVIHAGASVPILKLVHAATKIGLAGIVRLAGIPGWLGGAIFMNAGTFGEHIDGLIESVEILTAANEAVTLPVEQCGFEYRTSRFQNSGEIILSCTLSGDLGDPNEIAAEIDGRLERRRQTQPVDLPSCGCVYRNPGGDRSAGKLIQDAGLKGMRSGDAVISERHANFIVNEGNATAMDILTLMARIRKDVYELTGIKLIPEVRVAGFDQPLEVMLDAWKKN